MMNSPRASNRGIASMLVLAVMAAGCGPSHVALNAPAATAPPEVRTAAYKRLAPRRMHVIKVTSNDITYTGTDHIELADHVRVRAAEDLLPVVDSDSDTAKSIGEARTYSNTTTWMLLAGIGATVGGFAMVAADITGNHTSSIGWPFYAGLGVSAGGVIDLALLPWFYGKKHAANSAAFNSYHNDMMRRLDMCESDHGAEPCQ